MDLYIKSDLRFSHNNRQSTTVQKFVIP